VISSQMVRGNNTSGPKQAREEIKNLGRQHTKRGTRGGSPALILEPSASASLQPRRQTTFIPSLARNDHEQSLEGGRWMEIQYGTKHYSRCRREDFILAFIEGEFGI
jgi:hypothetical protein